MVLLSFLFDVVYLVVPHFHLGCERYQGRSGRCIVEEDVQMEPKVVKSELML